MDSNPLGMDSQVLFEQPGMIKEFNLGLSLLEKAKPMAQCMCANILS